MPEYFFEQKKITAPAAEVRRKGMSEHVRVEIRYPRLCAQVLDDPEGLAPVDGFPVRVEKQKLDRAGEHFLFQELPQRFHTVFL